MIPFTEVVYLLLCEKLKTTVWNTVGQIEERSRSLMKLHNKYIEIYQKHLSVEQIAESLFLYDKHLRSYNPID